MKLNEHTLDFILEIKWDTLPGNIQHQAKRCLLDTMCSLIAGHNTPVAKLMYDFAKEQFKSDDVTILVKGGKLSATGAALVNGFANNALGAAEYHAPIASMMKCIELPAMGKDSIGWGCMVAMMSVMMADNGFTGIDPIFNDSPEAEWINSLGSVFEIMNLYFKPYCCSPFGW